MREREHSALCNVIAPPSDSTIKTSLRTFQFVLSLRRLIEGVSFNGVLKEHELLKDYLNHLISFIKLRVVRCLTHRLNLIALQFLTQLFIIFLLHINKAESVFSLFCLIDGWLDEKKCVVLAINFLLCRFSIGVSRRCTN